MSELAAVHRNFPLPTDEQAQWLIGQGVPVPALFNPWVIRCAEVVFTGRTFEFQRHAERVISLRCPRSRALHRPDRVAPYQQQARMLARLCILSRRSRPDFQSGDDLRRRQAARPSDAT